MDDRDQTTEIARRRRPDPLTLVVGLIALAVAAGAFVDGVFGLPAFDYPAFDPRWLLAGGAALLGVLLLVGSLRGRRR